MISRPVVLAGGQTPKTSSAAAYEVVHSSFRHKQASCLEVIQQLFWKAGFLEQVAKITTHIRRSSAFVCQEKWSTFYDWYLGGGITLSKAAAQYIADFFVFLQKRKGVFDAYLSKLLSSNQ